MVFCNVGTAQYVLYEQCGSARLQNSAEYPEGVQKKSTLCKLLGVFSEDLYIYRQHIQVYVWP